MTSDRNEDPLKTNGRFGQTRFHFSICGTITESSLDFRLRSFNARGRGMSDAYFVQAYGDNERQVK